MISIGARGTKVRSLQEMLVKEGYLPDKREIDSIFGPKTRAAVVEFQKNNKLKVDGIVGDETSREIMFLKYQNFNSHEFKCKCRGAYCDGFPAKIDEDLVTQLQRIRNSLKRPVIITSGLRCERHNINSGGVKSSLHLKGRAADIRSPGVSVKELGKLVVDINSHGGCGISYDSFVHLDTGSKRIW
jgi:hypothetical protein